MEFYYAVNTGKMYLRSGEDTVEVDRGYSGYKEYRNSSHYETKVSAGSIPRGVWSVGFGETHPRLGPQAIPLEFESGGEPGAPFGRTGFFIHGDNKLLNFSASIGCIILPRSARDCIDHLSRRSGVRRLVVGKW